MGLINNQILTAYEGMIEEIMDSVPPINHMDEFFESIQIPCRTNYTPKSALRCIPKYVRNPAIRDLPPPPVPKDVISSQNLDTEMSLLELEEYKLNFSRTLKVHFTEN